jgi:bifunctional UDP-N-acetylglucosamine pyrophosphorylase/glucosamine-1-phosphate N-acetyltransferase
MKSALPKVLQPVAGQPMLAHVIEAARARPAALHVVYGHGGERCGGVRRQADLCWDEQARSWAPAMRWRRRCRRCPTKRVLVLYGDVPLIRPETLRACWHAGRLAVLAAEPTIPPVTGASSRPEGKVAAIVEQKDADEEQRASARSTPASSPPMPR